jgi:hypothetical protein
VKDSEKGGRAGSSGEFLEKCGCDGNSGEVAKFQKIMAREGSGKIP